MVPSRLPPGDYELTLRSTQPDGTQATSQQSVPVSQPTLKDQPNVALITPDRASLVPSSPFGAVSHLPPIEEPETVNSCSRDNQLNLSPLAAAFAGPSPEPYVNFYV